MPSTDHTPPFAAARFTVQAEPMDVANTTYRLALLDAATGKTLKTRMSVSKGQIEAAAHELVARQDSEGPEEDPVTHAARALLALICLGSQPGVGDRDAPVDNAALLAHLSHGLETTVGVVQRIASDAHTTGERTKSGPWAVTTQRSLDAIGHLVVASGELATAAEQAQHAQDDAAA